VVCAGANMRRWVVALWLGAVLVGAVSAQEQGAIAWSRDVQRSVALAKKTKRPLMFWVLGRSRSRDHRTERDQKRAFRDPLVLELSKRFVPVRLSRSRYREQLEAWDLSRRTNMDIVFVTPAGKRIDVLSSQGARNPQTLARKMALVFAAYRADLFERELKAKFDDEETPEAELVEALRVVRELVILPASSTVVKLLERPKLSAKLRGEIYETLAVLSTRVTVAALLDRAGGDPQAAAALGRCVPSAVPVMLEKLGSEDEALHLAVYHAVTRICGIRDVRPDRFWKGRIASLKRKENERVRTLASRYARWWKDRYEEYR